MFVHCKACVTFVIYLPNKVLFQEALAWVAMSLTNQQQIFTGLDSHLRLGKLFLCISVTFNASLSLTDLEVQLLFKCIY